jgi:hypothetical protein
MRAPGRSLPAHDDLGRRARGSCARVGAGRCGGGCANRRPAAPMLRRRIERCISQMTPVRRRTGAGSSRGRSPAAPGGADGCRPRAHPARTAVAGAGARRDRSQPTDGCRPAAPRRSCDDSRSPDRWSTGADMTHETSESAAAAPAAVLEHDVPTVRAARRGPATDAGALLTVRGSSRWRTSRRLHASFRRGVDAEARAPRGPAVGVGGGTPRASRCCWCTPAAAHARRHAGRCWGEWCVCARAAPAHAAVALLDERGASS